MVEAKGPTTSGAASQREARGQIRRAAAESSGVLGIRVQRSARRGDDLHAQPRHSADVDVDVARRAAERRREIGEAWRGLVDGHPLCQVDRVGAGVAVQHQRRSHQSAVVENGVGGGGAHPQRGARRGSGRAVAARTARQAEGPQRLQRPRRIDQAVAVDRVDAGGTEVGGRAEKNLPDLPGGQVRVALEHPSRGTTDPRRGEGRTPAVIRRHQEKVPRGTGPVAVGLQPAGGVDRAHRDAATLHQRCQRRRLHRAAARRVSGRHDDELVPLHGTLQRFPLAATEIIAAEAQVENAHILP